MSSTLSMDRRPAYDGGAEPPRQRRWPRRAGVGVGAAVVLLAGVGIGAAANNDGPALASAKSSNTVLHGQVTGLHTTVSALRGQVSAAQDKADNAVSAATKAANQKAAAAYASRNAAVTRQASSLKQQQSTLSAQQHAVKSEMGELQSSQINGDGVYVVGKDIKPGVYHTNGSGDTGADDCYYATLNSTNTDDISDNNNFDGPETVDVSSAYALDISGGCTWVKVG